MKKEKEIYEKQNIDSRVRLGMLTVRSGPFGPRSGPRTGPRTVFDRTDIGPDRLGPSVL